MSVVVEDTFGGELAIGRELDGRFTILEKLGVGGMGAVYRAHQRSVDREVAIKVIRLDLIESPEAIKLFLREAKLTSKLNHPNAVGVLDFGQTEDGVFYLAMELVKGRHLDQVLRDEGRMTPARVVRIGMQVCDALETAHAMQIVHRDLKPANIMLVESRRDFVKVLDFGLAKTLEAHREVVFSDHELRQIPAEQLQMTTMHGTPAFLPPERSVNGLYDARSDLYSLGCVLYLLASGELPFHAANAKELVMMHSTSRPKPLHGVPPTIAAVIEKLLSKNPDERYQTAVETRDALEEAALIDGVPSYQSSPSLEQARLSGRIVAPSIRISQPAIEVPREATPAPPRRRSRVAWFVGGGALLALTIAIVVVSTNRSESSPPAEPVTTSPPEPAPPVPAPQNDPPRPTEAGDRQADLETKPVSDRPADTKPEIKTQGRPVTIKKRPRPPKPTPPVAKEPATASGKPKLPF